MLSKVLSSICQLVATAAIIGHAAVDAGGLELAGNVVHMSARVICKVMLVAPCGRVAIDRQS